MTTKIGKCKKCGAYNVYVGKINHIIMCDDCINKYLKTKEARKEVILSLTI